MPSPSYPLWECFITWEALQVSSDQGERLGFNRLRCLGGVSAMNQRINREVSFLSFLLSWPCRVLPKLSFQLPDNQRTERKAMAIKPLSKPFLERSMNGTKTALRDVLCCLNPDIVQSCTKHFQRTRCFSIAWVLQWGSRHNILVAKGQEGLPKDQPHMFQKQMQETFPMVPPSKWQVIKSRCNCPIHIREA